MRLQKFVFVLLLISSAASIQAGGRFVPQQIRDRQRALQMAFAQSRIVEFELNYDFSVPGETRNIKFIVLVPKSIPGRQNILSTSYSPRPLRIFNKNSNRYAEFVFDKPGRQEKVRISIKAELFRYDLFTARKNRDIYHHQNEQLVDFLKHEKYIEKNHPRIQEIAGEIEGETEIEIVKNIYDYVLDNMEYSILGRKEWGAAKAVQFGKGDCTEYSDLFVALCRARNIPARVTSGYTVGFSKASKRHNWAEVYLQEYGWVPFDPSNGDIRNPLIRGRAFSNLRPVYIYLSGIRNDELLGRYNFGAYKYWGDRIKFKDSIEFKHFAPLNTKKY
ncbi:MAG: transglutaminase-like domain-containing protein [Planctomycetota bacterium]|jgi:transglutaminase-like putative cysteine protease